MTTAASSLATTSVELSGLPLAYAEAGSGDPLLVLPHETGTMSGAEFRELLSAGRRVIAPTLPGWDGTERHEWMTSVRDMAALLHLFLDKLGVDRLDVVGLGFGGWIAAEMATTNQARFAHLVLVNAYGLQPDEGEILDMFLFGHEAYLREGYHDEARFTAHYAEGLPSVDELVEQDENREMTARLAWKPYMFSYTLPALLSEVRTPTRVIWSREGKMTPVSCARQYVEALPNATMEVIEDAGHFVELEQPRALADAVEAFCSS